MRLINKKDTVKEFTTRHQEQFLPYDAPHIKIRSGVVNQTGVIV